MFCEENFYFGATAHEEDIADFAFGTSVAFSGAEFELFGPDEKAVVLVWCSGCACCVWEEGCVQGAIGGDEVVGAKEATDVFVDGLVVDGVCGGLLHESAFFHNEDLVGPREGVDGVVGGHHYCGAQLFADVADNGFEDAFMDGVEVREGFIEQ